MNLGNHIPTALSGLFLVAPLACTQIAGLDTSYASAIDAPCHSSADCGAGVCNGDPGWCTVPCAADGDCLEGSCVETKSQIDACFPACATNADCAVYGVPGLTCQAATTIDGIAASICTLEP